MTNACILSLSLTVRGVRASFCVHLNYFLPRSCQRHRSSTSELKGFPINFSLAPSHGRTKSLSSSEFRMSEFTAHPVATSEVTPSLSTMTNTCILSLSLCQNVNCQQVSKNNTIIFWLGPRYPTNES